MGTEADFFLVVVGWAPFRVALLYTYVCHPGTISKGELT
jgi:hypothetical protein